MALQAGPGGPGSGSARARLGPGSGSARARRRLAAPAAPARAATKVGRVWTTWRAATQDALYGGDGFYARGERPAAHFRTSVHASQRYAEAILALLSHTDAALGHPERLDLVDIGAGQGELLSQVLELAQHPPAGPVSAGPCPACLPVPACPVPACRRLLAGFGLPVPAGRFRPAGAFFSATDRSARGRDRTALARVR